MIYNRVKTTLNIAEVWYTNSQIPLALKSKPDVIRCHYMNEMPPKGVSQENLFTILIELSQTEEEIIKKLSNTTRYQVNRGKLKDDVIVETFFASGCKDVDKITQYINFFNDFARSKNRGLVIFSDYEKFITENTLCIRTVQDINTHENLSMHAYIVSDSKARLHQSSSTFRNLDDKNERSRIGRANRFLHFDDMIYFKQLGISFYDFGGWYGGKGDQQKIAINQFKESFGGQKHPEFSCVIPVSFKGKLFVFAREILKRLKIK
ncbi:MAG TPA: hypothetical protein VJ861_10750 [Treponemataceae bacterium]|nr:hypothetical protein [Treponemataceae bacterium]